MTLRVCRVCLAREDKGKEIYESIFAGDAEVAQKLNRLTGVLVIDLDDEVPSLICNKCTSDVINADILRKRFLDTNVKLSACSESARFKEQLQNLTKVVHHNITDRNRSPKFYVPRNYLKRNMIDKQPVSSVLAVSEAPRRGPGRPRKQSYKSKHELFECPTCKKSYSSDKARKAHLRTHRGKKLRRN